jgi:hypothetical protein
MDYFVFKDEPENICITDDIGIKDGYVNIYFICTGEIRQVKKHTLDWKTRRKIFRQLAIDEVAFLLMKLMKNDNGTNY